MQQFLFWTGIVIFLAGIVVRYIFKTRYYRAYRSSAHTDLQKQELRNHYRPLIFIGLGIQAAGAILSLLSCL